MNKEALLFTIGFTNKTAEQFFGLLADAGVKSVIDTRLNNKSQLSGFSKAADLPYFLRRIANIGYRHAVELAPTQDILDSYKSRQIKWHDYEIAYRNLLDSRRVIEVITQAELADACLLCSEHKPERCHRRVAAEYFQAKLPRIQIVHLF
jgi:uncharacterized protein (DUF488 family)